MFRAIVMSLPDQSLAQLRRFFPSPRAFSRIRAASAAAWCGTRPGRFTLAAVMASVFSLAANPVTPVQLAPAPLTDAVTVAYQQANTALSTPANLAGLPLLPPLQVERTLKVERNETFAAAMQRAGFSAAQAKSLLNALGSHGGKLKAGEEITLRYEEAEPYAIQTAEVTFRPQPDLEATLTVTEGTQVAAVFADKPLVQQTAVSVGRIDSSLYADATAAGMSPGMVKQFMDMFAWDIDYTRDIHPGDTFKVSFEETVDDRGRRVKTGRILAAAFTVDGETRQAFFWNGEYLNEKGESKRKLLLRTPLETYRISSNFNLNRKHPVLGYTRAHKGTDFAAPTGTPVKASGDGVVTYVGRHGGHGNYVAIRHNGTYTTAYAHLSRYSRGLRVGQKVSQGQIIAYVGSTGVSTGPHLHYEVIKNGRHVDAMRTDLPTGSMLAAADKKRFLAKVGDIQVAWNKALGNRALASR